MAAKTLTRTRSKSPNVFELAKEVLIAAGPTGYQQLRGIEWVDFRKGSETLYAEFLRSNRQVHLKPGDIIFLTSLNQRILKVMHGFEEVVDEDGNVEIVLKVTELRRARGNWEPAFLDRYCKKYGIKVAGLEKFARAYKVWRKYRTEVAVKRKLTQN